MGSCENVVPNISFALKVIIKYVLCGNYFVFYLVFFFRWLLFWILGGVLKTPFSRWWYFIYCSFYKYQDSPSDFCPRLYKLLIPSKQNKNKPKSEKVMVTDLYLPAKNIQIATIQVTTSFYGKNSLFHGLSLMLQRKSEKSTWHISR